jgi:hypothetical protein
MTSLTIEQPEKASAAPPFNISTSHGQRTSDPRPITSDWPRQSPDTSHSVRLPHFWRDRTPVTRSGPVRHQPARPATQAGTLPAVTQRLHPATPTASSRPPEQGDPRHDHCPGTRPAACPFPALSACAAPSGPATGLSLRSLRAARDLSRPRAPLVPAAPALPFSLGPLGNILAARPAGCTPLLRSA